MKTRNLLLVLSLSTAPMLGSAITVSGECTMNLTVQPTGPRQGNNGLRGFNIEGANNNLFSSYGVAQFQPSALGLTGTVADINSLTLKLYNWDAAFSLDGPVNVWFCDDTTTPIVQENPNLLFDLTDVPNGFGATNFSTRVQLGTLAYSAANADGFENAFTVSNLNPLVEATLIARLNSNTPFLILASPGDVATAATYAGFNHATFTGPTIEFDLAYTGSSTSVSGTVTLNDIVSSPAGIPVTVHFFNGTTLVDTQQTTLDGSGNYTVNPVASGNLTVKIDSPHMLRKSAGQFNISGTVTGVNATLTNGDVDGSDEVDAIDIDEVIASFGQTGSGVLSDVNNSQEVDATDIDIVIANFGAVSE